jgi:hypothetical protein
MSTNKDSGSSIFFFSFLAKKKPQHRPWQMGGDQWDV